VFIYPINREFGARNTPRTVIGLIVVDSLLLLTNYVVKSPGLLFKTYGFTPAHPQALTLFTSMFLHTGFLHLAGNMFFLWMFGKDVENSFGTWLFLPVYLLCGLGGSFLHYLFNLDSTIPCIGASGAISGIVGCFLVLFPKARFDLEFYIGWIHIGTMPTQTKAAVSAWIGEQALLGLLFQSFHVSSIAFFAHVGGFAVGVIVAGCFKALIPLGADGIPIVRPWFIPTPVNTEHKKPRHSQHPGPRTYEPPE
jgi:membrane associated rhomboid family serine protease